MCVGWTFFDTVSDVHSQIVTKRPTALFSFLQPKFCFSESPSQPLAAAEDLSPLFVAASTPNGNVAGADGSSSSSSRRSSSSSSMRGRGGGSRCINAEAGRREAMRFTRMRAVRGLVSTSLIALRLKCRPLTSHGRLAQRNQSTKKPTMP